MLYNEKSFADGNAMRGAARSIYLNGPNHPSVSADRRMNLYTTRPSAPP